MNQNRRTKKYNLFSLFKAMITLSLFVILSLAFLLDTVQATSGVQDVHEQQNSDSSDLGLLFTQTNQGNVALAKDKNAFFSKFTRHVSLSRNVGTKKTLISIERKNSADQNVNPVSIVVEISDFSTDPNVQKSLDNLSEQNKTLFFERRDAILTAVAAILPKVSRVQTFATTITEKLKNGVQRVRSQMIELDDASTLSVVKESREANLFKQLEEINQTLLIFSNKIVHAEEIQFAMAVGGGYMAHIAKYSNGRVSIPGIKILDGIGLAIGIGYNFKTKSATLDIFTDSARFYKQFVPLVVSFGANASYSIRAIMADGAVPSVADSGYTVGLPGVPFTVSSFDKEMSISGYIPGAPSVTLPVSVAISGAVRTTLLSIDVKQKAVRIANLEVKVPRVGVKLAQPLMVYLNHFSALNLTTESQAEVDVFDKKIALPAQATVSFLKARFEKFQNAMLKVKGKVIRSCALVF